MTNLMGTGPSKLNGPSSIKPLLAKSTYLKPNV